MVPAAVRAQNISTVAGGGPPATVTTLLKTGASVGAPAAVRQDSLGNTYILDNDFSRVYKVDTTGHLTVFAGNGTGSATSIKKRWRGSVRSRAAASTS